MRTSAPFTHRLSARHITLALALLLALILTLSLSACGGDSTNDSISSENPITPTVDAGTPLPTATPADTSTPVVLPVTWTPEPTLPSPTPKPTIAHTLTRPTSTPVILPSYTPSEIPPTATPPGPLLSISADMLTTALAEELQPGSGGFFTAPPVVTFQDGIIVLTLDIFQTPGDPSTARTLALQANVATIEGRIEATHLTANFTDNNALYRSNDLTTNLLDTLNTRLNNLVVQLYGGSGERFFVSEITVTPGEITVQTVTVPD